MVRSSYCSFQSYCDALVDGVWMVKVVRVTGSFCAGWERWEKEVRVIALE